MMKVKEVKDHQLPYALLITKILKKNVVSIIGVKKTVLSKMCIKLVNGVYNVCDDYDMFALDSPGLEDQTYGEITSIATITKVEFVLLFVLGRKKSLLPYFPTFSIWFRLFAIIFIIETFIQVFRFVRQMLMLLFNI